MSDPPWVAIVDDDDAVRSSLARLLRAAGIPAVGFGSAEEFLNWPAGPEPGCVLLDLHLGSGLTGPELRDRLESAGRPLPIVFMTGQTDAPCPESSGRPVEILRKPFEADDVLARVRRHVQAALDATPA